MSGTTKADVQSIVAEAVHALHKAAADLKTMEKITLTALYDAEQAKAALERAKE